MGYSVKLNREQTVKMPKRKRTYDKEPSTDSDFDPELTHTRPIKRRNKLAKCDESVYYPEDTGKPQYAPDKEEDTPEYARYQDNPGAKRIYKRSKCHHDEIAVAKVMKSKMHAERSLLSEQELMCLKLRRARQHKYDVKRR